MADQDGKRQDSLNTVIVALIAGLLAGFYIAMLMGFFDIGGKKDEGITSWLQGAASAVATLVSIYAVYLVSQTLVETKKTLEITQKIGDAQTRAWVMMDDCKLNNLTDGSKEIKAFYKNYGTTPARDVVLKVSFISYITKQTGVNEFTIERLNPETFDYLLRNSLPPGKTAEYLIRRVKEVPRNQVMHQYTLTMTYKTINDDDERIQIDRFATVDLPDGMVTLTHG